jgi:hypothetical protein
MYFFRRIRDYCQPYVPGGKYSLESYPGFLPYYLRRLSRVHEIVDNNGRENGFGKEAEQSVRQSNGDIPAD